LGNNVNKSNKINGPIRRNSGRSIPKVVQLRFHEITEKPVLLFGYERQILTLRARRDCRHNKGDSPRLLYIN
jgi:hypothetical protein